MKKNKKQVKQKVSKQEIVESAIEAAQDMVALLHKYSKEGGVKSVEDIKEKITKEQRSEIVSRIVFVSHLANKIEQGSLGQGDFEKTFREQSEKDNTDNKQVYIVALLLFNDGKIQVSTLLRTHHEESDLKAMFASEIPHPITFATRLCPIDKEVDAARDQIVAEAEGKLDSFEV